MESPAQSYPRQTLDLLDRVVPDGDGAEALYGLSRVQREPAVAIKSKRGLTRSGRRQDRFRSVAELAATRPVPHPTRPH